MQRFLRTPILAGLVALAFAACGGGGGNPPNNGDGGGTGDGPHIQFDGGTHLDGGGQQDGGGGQQDGGGGTECVTTGGKPTAGLCKSNGDCTCPNNCGKLYTDDPSYAGSCWKPCTATTDCAASGEECVGFTQTERYCLPVGTLTGTGLNGIAMLDAAPALPLAGTANVIVQAGDINATMNVGYGRKSSSGAYYFIFLMGGTASAPDQTKSVSIACDATKWSAKAYDLSKPTTDGCQIEYDILGFNASTGKLTSYTMNAIVLDGTMTVTAAGTGAGAPVTATFSGPPTVVKVIEELCGPNSTAC